jgi:hypothetical protein
MTDLSLTIDDTVLGMTPIGTYSSEYESWLWAWANEDFPLAARRAAERIRTLHDITGFRAFLDPGIRASPADSRAATYPPTTTPILAAGLMLESARSLVIIL